MRRWLDVLWIRAAQWVLAACALHYGIEGAGNVLSFFIFATLPLATLDAVKAIDGTRSVEPRDSAALSWVATWSDILFAVTLIWFGWLWTAVAFIARQLFSAVAREETRKRREAAKAAAPEGSQR